MLNETVFEWLDKKGYADRITEHTETIDTVEHAAQQIGSDARKRKSQKRFLLSWMRNR